MYEYAGLKIFHSSRESGLCVASAFSAFHGGGGSPSPLHSTPLHYTLQARGRLPNILTIPAPPPLDGARLAAAPQQGVRTHRGQLYLRFPIRARQIPSVSTTVVGPRSPPPSTSSASSLPPCRRHRQPRPSPSLTLSSGSPPSRSRSRARG
jgi:hypothetical protein